MYINNQSGLPKKTVTFEPGNLGRKHPSPASIKTPFFTKSGLRTAFPEGVIAPRFFPYQIVWAFLVSFKSDISHHFCAPNISTKERLKLGRTEDIRSENAETDVEACTTYHDEVVEKASWRSGDAADCKSVYTGSIPVLASNYPLNQAD